MYTNHQSEQLFEKAKQLMPGGVNSPVRAFRSVYGTPIFFKNGKGCHVTDEDGNKYIDFCCSWGPLILGHADPDVEEAIIAAVRNGTSFGAPTALENQLAALIIDNHPVVEKIRFVSSGTEAVMSALRLARGYTGKSKIVKFEGCYHGHADSLLVKAGSGLVTFGVSTSAGVPDSFAAETIVLPLNDLEALEQTLLAQQQEIAAIIIEPIPANNGLLLQENNFLTSLRALCTKYGILLIFDEVISGFRVGFSGASGHYNIHPDIVTFGKIIGGGMPVGAYGASVEIMSKVSPDGPVYQAGTLSGNPVAMAAGIAALTKCLQPNFYKDLEDKTSFFIDLIQKEIDKHHYPVHIFHIGSIFWWSFSNADAVRSADEIDANSMDYFKKLHRFLLERGVYFGPSGYEVGFVSAAHEKEDLVEAAMKINEGLAFIYAT
ncbi:MAG: glutamate-1-semialdehyde 2,1-aminomutase [Chitinophagales bacterium]|nr:glutamate-1-semialdehyde 2,1-aminomutase [Chitinophagales bacterium]